MINLEKLNKVASPDSSWVKEADERIKNRDWLEKSARIALKILRALKDKSMKQTDLAEALNVSPQQINKIIKGQENLTLETICKIEKALNIEIICIELPTAIKYITSTYSYNNSKYYGNVIKRYQPVAFTYSNMVECLTQEDNRNKEAA